MATLKKTKRGNWILRYWIPGVRPDGKRELLYRNLGKMSHAEAKEEARRLTAKSDESKKLENPNITFGDLAALWLKLHGPKLRPRTLVCTNSIITMHLIPAFGKRRVRDLRAVDVERWRTEEMSRKGAPAASTMNGWVKDLRRILSWGAAKEIVPNPIAPRSTPPLEEAERVVYFEPGEWQRFLAAADTEPRLAITAPVWKLQLLTASRIGEMADLTWGNVDFNRKVVTIFQSKVSRPKTLRMTEEMERVLSGLTRGLPAAPVFVRANGRPWRTDALDYYFHEILAVAELDGGGVHGMFTTHSVRHTAATWAIRAQVPLDRISAVLGHADLKMASRYAHLRTEDLDGALGAIEKAASLASEKTTAGLNRDWNGIARFPEENAGSDHPEAMMSLVNR